MLQEERSPLVRYSVAVVAVAFALLITLGLQALLDPVGFPLFFASVMVGSWYGGLGPGLLATALAAAAIDGFFLHAPGTFMLNLNGLLRLGVFVPVALLISSLTAERKRAAEALRKAHDELEERVEERTAELAQVTRELAERNRELLRLQREMGRVEPLAALGRITGTIAHELGTPLNSVLGYSQLLTQEKLPESARESVKIIEAQVHRMADIIRHYLSQTRSSPRQHSQININELVKETLTLLKPIFQQHGVQVTTALAESLPPLNADGTSLQRVLINLLNNAIDALENGGTVTVATRESAPPDTPQAGIVIEVSDTGVGIPTELLPKIFDLFITTKASGKGTGLGLVICQEIVKAHGGTIEVTSQVGEGTCVRIFLPIDETTSPGAAAEEKKRVRAF